MKRNKIAITAVMMSMLLCACGNADDTVHENSDYMSGTTAQIESDTDSEPVETTSEEIISETEAETEIETKTETETELVTEETTEELTISEAVTETKETESVSAAVPVPVTPSEPDPEKFRLYNADVKAGYPELCDIENIKARQKNDVESFYDTEFAKGDYKVNSGMYGDRTRTDVIIPVYEKSTYKYIEEDVDYDGENEYYLMIENPLDYSNVDEETMCSLLTDSSIALTVYYIENTGEVSFVYFINNILSESEERSENNPPMYYIVDYGDCKHMIKWYWPACDGVGGSGFATLHDRDRFFELPIGGVNETMSNEHKMLITDSYTWIDENKWDGSEYTIYHYDEETEDENGEWITFDDYHDNPIGEPAVEKMKWYYAE